MPSTEAWRRWLTPRCYRDPPRLATITYITHPYIDKHYGTRVLTHALTHVLTYPLTHELNHEH